MIKEVDRMIEAIKESKTECNLIMVSKNIHIKIGSIGVYNDYHIRSHGLIPHDTMYSGTLDQWNSMFINTDIKQFKED